MHTSSDNILDNKNGLTYYKKMYINLFEPLLHERKSCKSKDSWCEDWSQDLTQYVGQLLAGPNLPMYFMCIWSWRVQSADLKNILSNKDYFS